MAKGSKLGPVLVGGLALAVLLLLADETPEPQPDKRKPAPPPTPPPPAPKPPRREPEPAGDDARDDETALARMLASEDRRRGVRIVIGWITVQRARRAKMSIYRLVTANNGYGRQEDGRHAATHERPTPETRELARGILKGRYYPSSQIRAHRPGGWAERKVKQSVSDTRLFDLQREWNEGIYASIENTNWLLYSTDAPIITAGPPYRDISARLDALPKVPALDPLVS